MPRIIQFRRGTTSGLSTVLGAAGELFVDTSLVTVVVHNGVTTGGITLARNADVLAAHTYTTKQTFLGSTTSFGSTLYAGTEVLTVTSTVATGVVNFDLTTQGILYTTANAGAAWIVNFRSNTTTSLNSLMSTGESISAVYMVTQGATAFFNTSVTIDGTAVTPRWQGGTAPTAGNTSSIDVYAYTIIKTASSTYTVLASQTQFK